MNICCWHPNWVLVFAKAQFGIIKQPTLFVFWPPPSSTTTMHTTSPSSPMATTSHHCRHHDPPPSLAAHNDNNGHQLQWKWGGMSPAPAAQWPPAMVMGLQAATWWHATLSRQWQWMPSSLSAGELSHSPPPSLFHINAGAMSPWVTSMATWQPYHQHTTMATMSTSTTTSTNTTATTTMTIRTSMTTDHPHTETTAHKQKWPPTYKGDHPCLKMTTTNKSKATICEYPPLLSTPSLPPCSPPLSLSTTPSPFHHFPLPSSLPTTPPFP